MANTHTDNSGNTMGGTVTIADLASFSFTDYDSNNLTVYEAYDLLLNDWQPEIEPNSAELENGVGIRATFKDGTKLSVSAWADCCDGNGYCEQCWDGITRYSRKEAR